MRYLFSVRNCLSLLIERHWKTSNLGPWARSLQPVVLLPYSSWFSQKSGSVHPTCQMAQTSLGAGPWAVSDLSSLDHLDGTLLFRLLFICFFFALPSGISLSKVLWSQPLSYLSLFRCLAPTRPGCLLILQHKEQGQRALPWGEGAKSGCSEQGKMVGNPLGPLKGWVLNALLWCLIASPTRTRAVATSVWITGSSPSMVCGSQ